MISKEPMFIVLTVLSVNSVLRHVATFFQGVAVAAYRCALISLDNGEISTVGAACVCIYFQRLGQYFCWPR